LYGRQVILVHEDAFFSAYLGDVIAASGATVVGIFPLAVEGAAFLERDPPPCALVLSTGVGNYDVVARAAVARGVAMLLAQPARPPRGVSPQTAIRHPVLTMPFAGFQVVDALHGLLPLMGTGVRASHGSHVCGH
jgi:hypothetical protein